MKGRSAILGFAGLFAACAAIEFQVGDVVGAVICGGVAGVLLAGAAFIPSEFL